jgi:hypothetical protein
VGRLLFEDIRRALKKDEKPYGLLVQETNVVFSVDWFSVRASSVSVLFPDVL